MAVIERELKFILFEARFKAIWDLAVQLLPAAEHTAITQVNHYYDTPDLKLHKQGITCRIRQKGAQLQGQLKRHDFGQSVCSQEETFYADDIPRKMTAVGEQVAYLGQLTTKRESLICDGFRLDFDTNHYFNRRDYELEIEYEESALPEVTALVQALGLSGAGKMPGKFSRFLLAYKEFLKNS